VLRATKYDCPETNMNPAKVGYAVYYRSDPVTDRDGEGTPDRWQEKYRLNADDPSDAVKDCNGDGYTNIEKLAIESHFFGFTVG
jgi:hypothetical protein